MPFFKDLAAQLNELLARQSLTRKLFALLVLLGVVALLVTQTVRFAGSPNWEVLYADLNAEQAKLVKDELTRAGEKFQTGKSREGFVVRVPEGRALDWRLELAQKVEAQGAGKGWDLFDPKEFGITSEEFKVKKYRALRGELSRTISRMNMIKSAVVELALPKEEIFAKDQKPPKASVLVTLQPDVTLSRSQVETIQSLVAGSVEGLTPALRLAEPRLPRTLVSVPISLVVAELSVRAAPTAREILSHPPARDDAEARAIPRNLR